VEVYDEKMVVPLQKANITVTSTDFNTDFRSVFGINYLLFGSDKSPHGTWYLDILCLNDSYFADGGDIVVTDFYKPISCEMYIPIPFWRAFLWLLIVIIVGLLVGCFCTQRKKHVYKRFHVNESGMYIFT
jgi:hypothetical protein